VIVARLLDFGILSPIVSNTYRHFVDTLWDHPGDFDRISLPIVEVRASGDFFAV
jgi:hypothetical protein